MDILYESCAGIDVHQSNVVVCVLHGPLTSTRSKREEIRFDTTTQGLKDCHDFLQQFETAGHLASWAGLCPENNESSGKKRSTKIRHGNSYLKRNLCQAVFAGRKQKGSLISQKYYQIQARRGPQKATIATAHYILKLAYFLLEYNLTFQEYQVLEKGMIETSYHSLT